MRIRDRSPDVCASNIDRLIPPAEPDEAVVSAAAAAILAQGTGPWGGVSGFRLNAPADRRVSVEVGGSVYLVDAADDSVPLHDIDGMRILFADGTEIGRAHV